MKMDADTLLALHELYADYGAALDARELQRWPGFFTEDCIYKLKSRENFDRGLPLATMSFESRAVDAVLQHAAAFEGHRGQRQAAVKVFARLQFVDAVFGKEAGPALQLTRVQRGGVVGIQILQREQGVGVHLHKSITSRQ